MGKWRIVKMPAPLASRAQSTALVMQQAQCIALALVQVRRM